MRRTTPTDKLSCSCSCDLQNGFDKQAAGFGTCQKRARFLSPLLPRTRTST